MKILVTNDDGITAEGIKVLSSLLRTRHDVWMIAPHINRSGVSHGITMDDPLRFISEGVQEYSCSGLPVDCFISGVHGIMPSAPDVVVSGINRGANLGTDLVYSGTAAAARQAAIAGIPGIAVSLVSDSGTFLWEPLARFILENLETLMSLCEKDVFVNVNAPSLAKFRGARMTGISRRDYHDTVTMRDEPDGCKYSFFCGGKIQTEGNGATDWDAVESGCVSVSRVYAQPVAAPGGDGTEPDFRF
jgi:5'-nucleotidase